MICLTPELRKQIESDLGLNRPFVKGQDIPVKNCWHFSTDGNAVDEIFYCETDFVDGMNRIWIVSRKYNVIILAFSLMDTHVHFVLYGTLEECRRFMHEYRKLVCNEIDGQTAKVFNPSRLVYGQPARLKVGVNGSFSPRDVEWRVVSGPGVVTRGVDGFGETDWTATVTATADSGEVVVEARFNEDAIQPRFVLPIVQQRTLPVRAFVVNENNSPTVSAESIQSKIDYANVIFSQIGVQLSLLSVSNNVGTAADLILPKEQLYTNASGRVYWARSEQATALLNTYSAGDCIELYFVKKISSKRGGMPAALKSPLGIVVSQVATEHVVAHEIGHALGLEDCYSSNKYRRQPIFLANAGDSVSAWAFSNARCDWGLESGRGFYPQGDTIEGILSEMLMYGVDVGDSLDIPSGSVYSLKKDASSPLQTFSSKVGSDFIKSDLSEVYSQ